MTPEFTWTWVLLVLLTAAVAGFGWSLGSAAWAALMRLGGRG